MHFLLIYAKLVKITSKELIFQWSSSHGGGEIMADCGWLSMVICSGGEIRAGCGWSWVVATKLWLVVGGRGWLHDLVMPLQLCPINTCIGSWDFVLITWEKPLLTQLTFLDKNLSQQPETNWSFCMRIWSVSSKPIFLHKI